MSMQKKFKKRQKTENEDTFFAQKRLLESFLGPVKTNVDVPNTLVSFPDFVAFPTEIPDGIWGDRVNPA